MSRTEHLSAFAAFGIEAEYMIVDRSTLAVKPLCDKVLEAVAGEVVTEVSQGSLEWSNELVAHVIELKTDGPTRDLAALAGPFASGVQAVNALLEKHHAFLLPTAMHPFMDPMRETVLWQHGERETYAAYDRIFSCKGHGWSNLQSVHINLPFFDDSEFGRLHAAIRLALPILPALAASSPLCEGRLSGYCDTRLEFYRHNQRAVPEITGSVIPERAFSKAEYQSLVFDKIFAAIAPHDPEGELRYEWLNSRGAIARWMRHAIEIRVLDIQEAPRADAAMVSAVVGLVKALYDGAFLAEKEQRLFDEAELLPIFLDCVKDGDQARIRNADYLRALGYPGREASGQDLWRHILDRIASRPGQTVSEFRTELQLILNEGCLARRIMKAVGPTPERTRIEHVYRQLAGSLASNTMFSAA